MNNNQERPVKFTPDAAKRIAKATRAYEAAPQPSQSTNTPPRLSSPNTFPVKIKENADGGGEYWLTVLQPPVTDIDPTSTLAETDIGRAYTPSSDNTKVLGLYPPEIGSSTHSLAVGQVYEAVVHRRQTNGTLVVRIIGGGALPTGQYQFMYFGMVSQNQTGFMPLYASPITVS